MDKLGSRPRFFWSREDRERWKRKEHVCVCVCVCPSVLHTLNPSFVSQPMRRIHQGNGVIVPRGRPRPAICLLEGSLRSEGQHPGNKLSLAPNPFRCQSPG